MSHVSVSAMIDGEHESISEDSSILLERTLLILVYKKATFPSVQDGAAALTFAGARHVVVAVAARASTCTAQSAFVSQM